MGTVALALLLQLSTIRKSLHYRLVLNQNSNALPATWPEGRSNFGRLFGLPLFKWGQPAKKGLGVTSGKAEKDLGKDKVAHAIGAF